MQDLKMTDQICCKTQDLKMTDQFCCKIQDLKMTDHIASLENAGSENAGPENDGLDISKLAHKTCTASKATVK